MIKRETKAGQTHLTFVLPTDAPANRVSVVGDFNQWTPGAHTFVKRSNGTRSVKITVEPGTMYAFRYLAEDGVWFDDPESEARDLGNCVVAG